MWIVKEDNSVAEAPSLVNGGRPCSRREKETVTRVHSDDIYLCNVAGTHSAPGQSTLRWNEGYPTQQAGTRTAAAVL